MKYRNHKITQITLTAVVIILLSAIFTPFSPPIAIADTNIVSTSSNAWSDNAGWWDFHSTGNVEVNDSVLRGYATSSEGAMVLNCKDSPDGNICSSSDFRVSNVDGTGKLTGCAWNDTLGWIHFWCGDGDCSGSETEDASSTCASSDFRVTIDSNGYFQGYAWNDNEGWISFNCNNDDSCSESDFQVKTTWEPTPVIAHLKSVIIDTQKVDGTTLQSIVWHGTQPSGTTVDFQVATSNSTSGPWEFKGPDGTSNSYYGQECPQVGSSDPGAGPGNPICIDKSQTKNKRYVRYRIRMQSDIGGNTTPTVKDVILNWAE
ncbi:MAG: hypothetical protein ABEI53_00075 [Candidatus Magasanikbacteria bacterium]